MRHALAGGVVLVVMLAAVLARAQPIGDLDAASEPVLRQLEAFRRSDYDLAYTFASSQIRALFDRPAFERMVRSGYPEIADSTRARIVERRVTPEGQVLFLLKIRGANGRHVQAIYEIVWEAQAWKINGVVAQPDPGEET